jgi:hypothetical protein
VIFELQYIKSIFKALVIGIALASGSAFAVVELHYLAVNSKAEPGARTDFSVLIDRDELVLKSSPRSKPSYALLFRQASSQVIFIDHYNSQFIILTEEWLAKARENAQHQMDEMKSRVDKNQKGSSVGGIGQYHQISLLMKMLPLLGGLSSQLSVSPVKYTLAANDVDFNGFKCRSVEEYTKGEKTRVFCMADPKDVALSQRESELFTDFLAVMARMKQKGVFEFGFVEPPLIVSSDQLNGVPIAISWSDGSGYLIQQAKTLKSSKEFNLPANYLEAQIPLFDM